MFPLPKPGEQGESITVLRTLHRRVTSAPSACFSPSAWAASSILRVPWLNGESSLKTGSSQHFLNFKIRKVFWLREDLDILNEFLIGKIIVYMREISTCIFNIANDCLELIIQNSFRTSPWKWRDRLVSCNINCVYVYTPEVSLWDFL